MDRKRESITLSYPHDQYRRLKDDDYLSLDAKVAKINETCEERFLSSQEGSAIRTYFYEIVTFRFIISLKTVRSDRERWEHCGEIDARTEFRTESIASERS